MLLVAALTSNWKWKARNDFSEFKSKAKGFLQRVKTIISWQDEKKQKIKRYTFVDSSNACYCK